MTQKTFNTSLDDYDVKENILYRHGKEIARFPTPISALARLDERLFLLLHPYPYGDALDKSESRWEYIGTNLWGLDLQGNVIWKIDDINDSIPPHRSGAKPISYIEFYLFDRESPKILAMSDDDRVSLVADITSGHEISLSELKEQPVWENRNLDPKVYLPIFVGHPPKASCHA